MAPSWTWTDWEGLSREQLYAVLALRVAVFVVEQACAYQDLDGNDPLAHHLLGHDGGELVAYARVFAPGALHDEPVIGRVVVAASHRGTGLGRALVERAHHELGHRFGARPVRLAAQAHLRQFYGSLGYEVCGPGYDEDGIPHLPMRRG